MRRQRRRLATLVAALVAATGCSAPVDSGPKTLRAASIPEDLRSPSSTTTTTIPTGESEEVTVYFIGADNRLVPATRRVSPPVTVAKVIQKLFSGPPTLAEAVGGLRSAISPDTVILAAPIENRIATVDVSTDFAFGTLEEQIAAFAQVVFTALDVEGVVGVLFAEQGRRLEVPAGDGSLTSAPLGRASYAGFTPR